MSTATGTIVDKTIYSKHLQEERELMIYLPYNYSPLYTYHLLIAQDGADYFQQGRIARVADELIENKEIENVIIVGIPYKNVEERRKLYHPSGDKHESYLRFLATELIPFLEQTYPTYQLASGRTLIGDSLAGTASLLAALEYPHTFGQVILQSPFINNHIIDLIENFKSPQLLNIYHVIGKQETEVKTTDNETKDFLTPNRKLMEIMKQKRFHYFYDEFDGDHTWTYWQPDVMKALKIML